MLGAWSELKSPCLKAAVGTVRVAVDSVRRFTHS